MIEIQKSLVVHFEGLQSVKLDGEPEICLKPDYRWAEVEYDGNTVWFCQEAKERGWVEQKIEFHVFGQERIIDWIELSKFCKLVFLHYAETGEVFMHGVEYNGSGFVSSAYKDTKVFVKDVEVVSIPEKHKKTNAMVEISGTQKGFAFLFHSSPKLTTVRQVEAV